MRPFYIFVIPAPVFTGASLSPRKRGQESIASLYKGMSGFPFAPAYRRQAGMTDLGGIR